MYNIFSNIMFSNLGFAINFRVKYTQSVILTNN